MRTLLLAVLLCACKSTPEDSGGEDSGKEPTVDDLPTMLVANAWLTYHIDTGNTWANGDLRRFEPEPFYWWNLLTTQWNTCEVYAGPPVERPSLLEGPAQVDFYDADDTWPLDQQPDWGGLVYTGAVDPSVLDPGHRVGIRSADGPGEWTAFDVPDAIEMPADITVESPPFDETPLEGELVVEWYPNLPADFAILSGAIRDETTWYTGVWCVGPDDGEFVVPHELWNGDWYAPRTLELTIGHGTYGPVRTYQDPEHGEVRVEGVGIVGKSGTVFLGP